MFNHNIQLAGYPFERTDEKGAIDFAGFSHLFDTFPWQEQLGLAEKLEDGCSATISVKAIGEEKDLWISIASYKQSYIFLIGYVYLRSRKRFWGLGAEEIVRWVDIYEISNNGKIKLLFNLFFDQNYDKLKSELLLLKQFDSMKSYSQ